MATPTPTTTTNKFRTLADSTPEERMTPIEQQINPSLAAAVESTPENQADDSTTAGINREIDTVAANEDVNPTRAPGAETGDVAVEGEAASPPKTTSK